ncbi:MAG TPA: M48 family metallopeptidase [Kiloniellales bacterium]|jgi:putative metalloprotease
MAGKTIVREGLTHDEILCSAKRAGVRIMTMITSLKLFLIAAIVVFGPVACSQLDVNESPSGSSQSPQQYGAAAGDQPVAPLSTGQAKRLKHLMDPLIQHMNNPIPADSVKVTVMQDSQINAANAGGGDFYVTSGLLEKASDDNLRGVLAHEIAHADLGHINKLQTVGAGVGIGAALLGTIWPGTEQLAPLAGNILLSHYSRTEETAADMHGVEILRRAGFDGKTVMVNTLTWLMNSEGDAGGGFLATHPAIGDRIRDLRAMP